MIALLSLFQLKASADIFQIKEAIFSVFECFSFKSLLIWLAFALIFALILLLFVRHVFVHFHISEIRIVFSEYPESSSYGIASSLTDQTVGYFTCASSYFDTQIGCLSNGPHHWAGIPFSLLTACVASGNEDSTSPLFTLYHCCVITLPLVW